MLAPIRAIALIRLRVRIAALGVSWEHRFLDGEDLTTVKLGPRVAFDLDL